MLFSRVHLTLQVTLSVCRSVGWSVGRLVGLSHFAFLRFLGYLKVGMPILEYLVSYKHHLRLYKSLDWSVGPSVCLSSFAFFASSRLFKGREAHI